MSMYANCARECASATDYSGFVIRGTVHRTHYISLSLVRVCEICVYYVHVVSVYDIQATTTRMLARMGDYVRCELSTNS